MHAIHPVGSPILWLRVVAAAVVIVLLPGYLLAGRHVTGGRLERFVFSVSMGWLGTTVVARFLSLAGIPVLPWTVTPALALLGIGLGRRPAWRAVWARACDGWATVSPRVNLALVAVSICSMVVLIVTRHDVVVPLGSDDAANHSYLVRHIADTASLDPGMILATPFGSLAKGYLVGWHTGAALVSVTAGVAPYVTTWLLVLATLAFLPLALSLLWRAFGVSGPLVVLGACWLLTNAFMPAGILGWGGYGQIVGMSLVPLASIMVAAVIRDRSPMVAATAGAVLGALVHVHASEVVVAVGLGALVAFRRDTARRSVWPAAAVALASAAVVMGLEPWILARSYNAVVPFSSISERESLANGMTRLLGAAGGPDPRYAAVLLGIGCGLADRRLRRLAVVSLVLGGTYLCMVVLGDPVTAMLSRPFYSQAPRMLYLQAYILPPLLGLPITLLWSLRARTPWRRAATVVAVALSATWFVTGMNKTMRDLRTPAAPVTFAEAEYLHATRMTALVGPDEVILNRSSDGGVWAIHVSDRRGTMPHDWPRVFPDGSRLADRTDDLAAEPWPDRTRTLRDAGVVYLYVNDTVHPRDADSPLRRSTIDADERFEPILEGTTATLYRIRWGSP